MLSRTLEATSNVSCRTWLALAICLAAGCGLGVEGTTPKGTVDRQAFNPGFGGEVLDGEIAQMYETSPAYLALHSVVPATGELLGSVGVTLRVGQPEQWGYAPALQAEATGNSSPLPATVIPQEALFELGLAELLPSNLGAGQHFALVVVDTSSQPELVAALSADYTGSPTQFAALQGATMSDAPAQGAPPGQPTQRVVVASPSSGSASPAAAAQQVQAVGSWGACPNAVLKGLTAFVAGSVVALAVVYYAVPATATAAGFTLVSAAGASVIARNAQAVAAFALDMATTRELFGMSQDIQQCMTAVTSTAGSIGHSW